MKTNHFKNSYFI